jgi:tetratricopeptide (TPR) repeat protein
MTIDEATDIVSRYSFESRLSEDERFLLAEALTYMIEHDPAARDIWAYNLASYYDKIDEYDLAVKYYNVCLESRNVVAYLGLGDVYMHQKDYDRAMAYYQEAKKHHLYQADGRIRALHRKMRSTKWRE